MGYDGVCYLIGLSNFLLVFAKPTLSSHSTQHKVQLAQAATSPRLCFKQKEFFRHTVDAPILHQLIDAFSHSQGCPVRPSQVQSGCCPSSFKSGSLPMFPISLQSQFKHCLDQ